MAQGVGGNGFADFRFYRSSPVFANIHTSARTFRPVNVTRIGVRGPTGMTQIRVGPAKPPAHLYRVTRTRWSRPFDRVYGRSSYRGIRDFGYYQRLYGARKAAGSRKTQHRPRAPAVRRYRR